MPGMRRHDSPPVRRGFDLHIKALDPNAQGRFSGYLAVFDNVDLQGDRILPGAFTKSLNDLKARQQSRANTPGARYLFPIYWNHDSGHPCGGFVDAHEDSHGLFVVGELDLDTELGQQAYSAISKGYVPAMSIGYFVVTYAYDRANVRLLKELALFEGSIVATPANPEAVIMEVKSATGKADWPLASRNTAWSGVEAHKRIVAWATDSGGNVDTDKLKSVHFYSPESGDAQNVSEYKLLFCDVVGGDVKAVPRAIFACAGAHGVEDASGISADDKASIKSKITGYYAKMRTAFDDDSIVSPFAKDNGKSMNRRQSKGAKDSVEVSADGTHAAFTGTHTHAHKAFGTQGGDDMHEHEHTHDGDASHEHTHSDSGKSQKPGQRKARTFQQVFTTDREAYDILEDLDDLWCALRESLLSVLIEGANNNGDNAVAQQSLDQFTEAVMSWLEAAEMQDCWADIADAADDAQADMADYALYDIDASVKPAYYYAALSTTRAGAKAGRAISADNATAMQKALDMMAGGHTAAAKGMQMARAGHKQASALLKSMSAGKPSDATTEDDMEEAYTPPSSSSSGGNGGKSLNPTDSHDHSHDHAPGAPDSQASDTTRQPQPMTADDLKALIARKMAAKRLAAAALSQQQSA